MRCHVVTCKVPRITQYTASRDEAVQARLAVMGCHGIKKKDISVEPIDIPTTKAELIAWLNAR